MPDSALLTPPGLGHMLHHAVPGLIADVADRVGRAEEDDAAALSVAGEEDPHVAVGQTEEGALAAT